MLSAPAQDTNIPTVVYGVNVYDEHDGPILSCASCTTNCVAPVVEIVDRRLGLEKAVMNTIHAYTATQAIVDTANKKMRRGRAGAANLVPVYHRRRPGCDEERFRNYRENSTAQRCGLRSLYARFRILSWSRNERRRLKRSMPCFSKKPAAIDTVEWSG